eukprot:c15867_g1_i2.p1 GENE.c15867_g1_i2~~c15867_g1_i2.p1  ORF type:complete len:243 (+),score=86.08 c15867_g1_i2:61-789(+)
MTKILSLPQHHANSSSLCAIALTGCIGSYDYFMGDYVHLPSALIIAFSAMITAKFSLQYSSQLDERTLKNLFGVLLLLVAPLVPLKLYLSKHSSNEHKKDIEIISLSQVIKLSIAGSAAGFLAGMFGVGGGVIMVPILVLFGNFTYLQAVGTSLFAIIFPALSNTIKLLSLGTLQIPIALPLAIGSGVGTSLSAKYIVSKNNINEIYVQSTFVLLLIFVAVRSIKFPPHIKNQILSIFKKIN